MSVVRVLVNFMSSSNANRAVEGFHLGVLNKLVDVRSIDGKSTLLHTLVERVRAHEPELAKFVSEWSCLEFALERPIEKHIRPNIRVLTRDVEYVRATLHSLPADDPMVVKAQPVADRLASQIQGLDEDLERLSEVFASVEAMFGVHTRASSENEFLSILVRFRAQWIRAEADLAREAEVAKASERRRVLADVLAQRKAAARSGGNS